MKKEEKKPAYILCPRCELNYIKSKDKYCTVCKADMGLVDRGILLPDDEELGLEKLCPVCNVNYIGDDEDICFLCKKEREEMEANERKDEWEELSRDPDDVNGPTGILALDEEASLLSDEESDDEEDMIDDGDEDDDEVDDFDYQETLDGFDDEYDDDDDDDEYDDDEGF